MLITQEVLETHVSAQVVSGAVALVRRGNSCDVAVAGRLSFERDAAPMARDSIFRVASITKPMVAAVALTFVEDGTLTLDQPISEVLPEFSRPRVLRSLQGDLDDTEPVERPITVRDLLTFRSGLGLDFTALDTPIGRAALRYLGPALRHTQTDPDAWLQQSSQLPLLAQPGRRWLYNTGSDVLGILLSRVAGQHLGDLMRRRLFEPLGMVDTGFAIDEAQFDRFVSAYVVDFAGELAPPGSQTDWLTEPSHPSAHAGLVSTVDDIYAFSEMLRLGGRGANGTRVLSRPAVEAMTSDQLPEDVKQRSGLTPGWFEARGWGFGVGVVTRREGPTASPGAYGWDGGTGTSWWTDPAEDMTAVLLTQRCGLPSGSPLYRDFWSSVYGALE